MRSRSIIVLFTLAVAVPQTAVAQSRFGVNIFGLSYHYQSRTYLDASGAVRRYEQANPGLGAEYVVHNDDPFVVSAEMTSRTYGTPIAPLPVVTAHWKYVGLNGTWIPSLARRESGAFALFSTIYL